MIYPYTDIIYRDLYIDLYIMFIYSYILHIVIYNGILYITI